MSTTVENTPQGPTSLPRSPDARRQQGGCEAEIRRARLARPGWRHFQLLRGVVEIARDRICASGSGCGALEENDYRGLLAQAGFEKIAIEPTRIYRAQDARDVLSPKGIDVDAIAPTIDGKFMSAFIRAVKPV